MRSNQSNTVKYHFLDIFVIKLEKLLTFVQAWKESCMNMYESCVYDNSNYI